MPQYNCAMLEHYFNRSDRGYDGDWADDANAGPVGIWLGGIIIPLLFVAYAIRCLISHHGVLPGRYESEWLDVYGPRAVALAITSLGLGLFFHCHYFWSNFQRLAPLSILGKTIALTAFVGGLGYLIVQVGIWGRA